MRYMIAHMIEGGAKEYHMNLSRALASAYRLRPATAHNDPHLTVKAPFDALSSDLEKVEHILADFARRQSVSTYTMKGFGSFGDRVVYMDIVHAEKFVAFTEELKEELLGLPWLEFKSHESEIRPHATLCYPKDAAQATEILGKLTERSGREFTCSFDRVALLKRGERRWEVVRQFSIGGGVGGGGADVTADIVI